MPTEPLHIDVGETDVLIDGKSVPWFVRASINVDIFPQDHEGGDNGGVVWVGIPAHDITIDPNAKFVTVNQQKGCRGDSDHDYGDSCKTTEQQLVQWRASHVHEYAPARDILQLVVMRTPRSAPARVQVHARSRVRKMSESPRVTPPACLYTGPSVSDERRPT